MKKVMIQRGVLNDLKPFIHEHNQTHKPKLKLDVAVFFIGLINEIKSHYRDDGKENEFTPLDSQILKEYHSNYNKYFDFLVEYNVLERLNYSTDIGRSNGYKFTDIYVKDDLQSYKIKYDKLKEKFNEKGLDKHQQKKLAFSIEKRPHLMRIFNDDLTIDVKSAYDEIKHLRDTEPRKYNNAMVLINEFKNKTWKTSIKPYKSDNRLHTNLTRSPKVLRKHILISDNHIVGCDIKTSQPYFFCVILKAILSNDKELLEQINATKILNGNTIDQLFDLDIDRLEVIDFVNSIVGDNIDFYHHFETKLNILIDEDEQPYRMVSNFNSKNIGKSRSKRKDDVEPQTKKVFKTNRDLVKEVVMEIFYSSPMSKIPEAVIFRNTYPSIHKIIKCLYDNGVKFSELLTFIEAYILLDVVAKEISIKHPNMPLGSIHDSLVTTFEYEDLLKEEMINLIEEATTLKVKVDFEHWGQHHLSSVY